MRITATDIGVHAGRYIVNGVSLDVGPGELVGLLGPNGAGKTTLLRVLAGLRQPDRGTVRFDGMQAHDLGRAALARRVAYLAQGENVQWGLRCRDIVALGRLPHRRLLRGESAADRRAVADAMIVTDTLALATRTFHTLSGGERMRVLLARALAVEAPMLLADEPTTGLDPLYQLQAMEMLRRVAHRDSGVVVVLHDLSLATRYCDRLLLMSAGRLRADARPEAVSDTLIEATYGITVVRGEHQGCPFVLPWQIGRRPSPEEEPPDAQ